MRRSPTKILCTCSVALLLLLFAVPSFALTDRDIASFQKEISGEPLGERIAFWAEKFVGVPYDPDPLGEYVTKKVIVADDRVDCMYLSFRTVELALGRTPAESLLIALDKRFISKGIIENGLVLNYEDRFQYGEDMLDSPKWGREITKNIGPLSYVTGSRGRPRVGMVSRKTLTEALRGKARLTLKNGDFIFFVRTPEKRASDEIIGHIGIIKIENDVPYLIHASGKKNGVGKVRKVLLSDYVSSMPFAGIRVSRFP